MKTSTLILAALLSAVRLGAEEPATAIRKIIQPYTDAERTAKNRAPLAYGSKSVSKTGEIPDQLDCSTLASAVLHEYLNHDWSKFDQTIQQRWGDEIATAYKLGSGAIQASLAHHIEALDKKTLKPGVYYFDLRNQRALHPETAKRTNGAAGHTGFLIVEGTGAAQVVTQIHMSGTTAASDKPGGGLAYNKDRWKSFLTISQYGNTRDKLKSSQLTIYPLPMRPPAN